MIFFSLQFSRNLGSRAFTYVFLYFELISYSSLLEELAAQDISIFTGRFLSYRTVKHLFPDLLQ